MMVCLVWLLSSCGGKEAVDGSKGAADDDCPGYYDPMDSGNERASSKDAIQGYIPAGVFWMGCEPDDNRCIDIERPRHQVFLSSFQMDIYLVTGEEYADYLNNVNPDNECDGNPCAHSSHDDSTLGLYKSDATWLVDAGYEDRPATNITWYGAKGYCESLGKRLPTEAEWEKAAKGAAEHYFYPWGNCKASNASNFQDSGDPYETGPLPWTTPVGYFDGGIHDGFQTADGRSPYGIYDMAGNVWQWTSDWFQEDYYSNEPSGGWVNPQGPETGTERMLRGGGWDYALSNSRTSARNSHHYPFFWSFHRGFRCVQDAQ